MNRIKATVVAIGTTLLVGTLTAPASAGITIYKGEGAGPSKYYDYNDCDYRDNVLSDGSPLSGNAYSAYSWPTSTNDFYFYTSPANSNCINRIKTGYVRKLAPGEGASAIWANGHFKG